MTVFRCSTTRRSNRRSSARAKLSSAATESGMPGIGPSAEDLPLESRCSLVGVFALRTCCLLISIDLLSCARRNASSTLPEPKLSGSPEERTRDGIRRWGEGNLLFSGTNISSNYGMYTQFLRSINTKISIFNLLLKRKETSYE